MSKEEVQEKEQETTSDPVQDKIDEIERTNAAALASQAEDEEAKDEDEPKDSTDVKAETTFSSKQLDALEHLGVSSETATKLGKEGIELASRLVKIRSDTGRLHQKLGDLQNKTPVPAEKEAVTEELDEGEWGDVGKTVNTLLRQNKSLQSRFDTFEQQSEHTNDARITRDVDAFFASLDKELYPQFGDGPLKELSESGLDYEQRVKVINKAGELMIGNQTANQGLDGYEPMTRDEALKEALLVKFPNAKEKATGNKVKKRSGSQVNRASVRKSHPEVPEGNDAAYAAMEAWEKRTGLKV